MSRIELTANADFHVNPGGNDSTGDGTSGNPWASPIGAFNRLQAGYDLTGHLVTVNVAAGTYTQTNQFEGALLGQRNSASVVFQGSGSPSCFIKPDINVRGYAFSTNGLGCGVKIAGFSMDMLGPQNQGVGQDTTAVGAGSQMIWGNDLVFGRNINPWNHCSVNGTLLIESGPVGTPNNYAIKPQLEYRTISFAANATWLQLAAPADLAGIRLYQGVNGSYQHSEAHVVAIDTPNYRVQISHATSNTTAKSNMGVNFSNGAQCHILAGEGGRVQLVNNGEASRSTLTINHLPYFYYAYLGCYQGSSINYPAMAVTGGAAGRRYDVRSNGIIDCQANGVAEGGSETVLPGTLNGFKGSGGIYV